MGGTQAVAKDAGFLAELKRDVEQQHVGANMPEVELVQTCSQ